MFKNDLKRGKIIFEFKSDKRPKERTDEKDSFYVKHAFREIPSNRSDPMKRTQTSKTKHANLEF